MIRLKPWLRNFFGFSRTEMNAFLILLPLMFVFIFSEPIYRYWFVSQPHDFKKETKSLDSLIASLKWTKDDSTKVSLKGSSAKLFLFDPNQSSKGQLLSLGFRESLANRIINYRSKGGKFLVKRDMMKIYGMDSALFKKIFPYINLPEKIEKEVVIQKIEKKEKAPIVKFNLNDADTTQLISIYGIGSKLAQRIVSYREKLGGFIFESQLKEVYGLDSVVVKELFLKSFIDQDFKPKQININLATEKELAAHPYVKYKVAKAIVAYRMQHGNYKSVDELKKISLINEHTFEKMSSYLHIE